MAVLTSAVTLTPYILCSQPMAVLTSAVTLTPYILCSQPMAVLTSVVTLTPYILCSQPLAVLTRVQRPVAVASLARRSNRRHRPAEHRPAELLSKPQLPACSAWVEVLLLFETFWQKFYMSFTSTSHDGISCKSSEEKKDRWYVFMRCLEASCGRSVWPKWKDLRWVIAVCQ